MVPERWKPWALPTDSRWQTALPWWWVALGLGVLVIVLSGWDSRVGSNPFGRNHHVWGRQHRAIPNETERPHSIPDRSSIND